MSNISIYGGHNASVAFEKDGNYHVVELERLFEERYYMWFDKSAERFEADLRAVLAIANKHWDVGPRFDTCSQGANGAGHHGTLASVLQIDGSTIRKYDHHLAHAACSFYQSPYDEAIVISFDGGGNDGVFNVYHGKKGATQPLTFVGNSTINLGHAYMLLGYPIRELKGIKGRLPYDLAIAGKLMGLVAYGKVRSEWLQPIRDFYRSTDWSLPALGSQLKLNLGFNTLEGQEAYDLAATSQYVFGNLFMHMLSAIKKDELPICLAGGCALNVLLNDALRKVYGDKLFVPPNPDDGGLALGQLFLSKEPTAQVNVAFSGLPILDMDQLENYKQTRTWRPIDPKGLAEYLKQGKIVGVIEGDSEVGPRALGNRSIICDPSVKDMKDVLNAKVKFREWFRPFAPVTRACDAEKYFMVEGTEKELTNYQFMSFAPHTKPEWRTSFPAITHFDNTSRLQIVPAQSNTLFEAVLTELASAGEPPMILNTSFNIKGKPILSTLAAAFEVLDTTELDAVYTNGALFSK